MISRINEAIDIRFVIIITVICLVYGGLFYLSYLNIKYTTKKSNEIQDQLFLIWDKIEKADTKEEAENLRNEAYRLCVSPDKERYIIPKSVRSLFHEILGMCNLKIKLLSEK